MKKEIYTLFLLLTLVGCKPSSENAEELKQEIDLWHQKRIEYLLGPDGWVNLSGLFWLKEGINSFGSGEGNDIIFPEGKIALKAGFFILRDSTVSMQLLPGVEVLSDGKAVSSAVIFSPDSSQSKILESGVLQWFGIKRNEKTGIRLRDLDNPKLKTFKGIDNFETDVKWKVNAEFKSQPGKYIEMLNVLGQTIRSEVKGTLSFSMDGQSFQLDALEEDGELFIVFGDLTNGASTYGSGRYLYADIPEAGEEVILNFNKAYNPPCAFTEFATCLLPPKQNILPIEVRAGEKAYH